MRKQQQQEEQAEGAAASQQQQPETADAVCQGAADNQHKQQQQQQQASAPPPLLPPRPATGDAAAAGGSNVVDIDALVLRAGRGSSRPAPTTYSQVAADDAAAPPLAPQPRTNEVSIDDVSLEDRHAQQQQQQQGVRQAGPPPPHVSSAAAAAVLPRLLPLGRAGGAASLHGGGGMGDFGAGLDLIGFLNLDGIFLDNKESVTHEFGAPTRAQEQQQQQHEGQPEDRQQQQEQERARGSRSGRKRDTQQQQQQQATQPGLRFSAPRPHPFYVKPQHVKTHFMAPTSDGWKLHLIRTQVLGTPPRHVHPVILCPGLGSSGAYTFDLSPAVSLADYLADRGWDVWTCELRGNGMSDKPRPFSRHGRWWTIDSYVEKDVPAIIRYVLKETHAGQVHFLGHSMGGMILCGVMARVDTTTAKIRSCIAVGSGLFLEESWWRLFDRGRFLLHALWVVPTGVMLRAYSRLMFGPWRVPYLDMLYFWPPNVEPRVGRAMMGRNFSNISVGVIQQIATAFGSQGLLSADRKMVYADPRRLAKVTAPALFLVGDRDRMCPPEGCRRTWQMFGSLDKRFVCLGPRSGFADHYGHFDILMGKRVEAEVFPLIHQFLLQHDAPKARL